MNLWKLQQSYASWRSTRHELRIRKSMEQIASMMRQNPHNDGLAEIEKGNAISNSYLSSIADSQERMINEMESLGNTGKIISEQISESNERLAETNRSLHKMNFTMESLRSGQIQLLKYANDLNRIALLLLEQSQGYRRDHNIQVNIRRQAFRLNKVIDLISKEENSEFRSFLLSLFADAGMAQAKRLENSMEEINDMEFCNQIGKKIQSLCNTTESLKESSLFYSYVSKCDANFSFYKNQFQKFKEKVLKVQELSYDSLHKRLEDDNKKHLSKNEKEDANIKALFDKFLSLIIKFIQKLLGKGQKANEIKEEESKDPNLDEILFRNEEIQKLKEDFSSQLTERMSEIQYVKEHLNTLVPHWEKALNSCEQIIYLASPLREKPEYRPMAFYVNKIGTYLQDNNEISFENLHTLIPELQKESFEEIIAILFDWGLLTESRKELKPCFCNKEGLQTYMNLLLDHPIFKQ